MFEERSYRARRLPIYLLTDVSASMAGDKIVALNEGMHAIYHQLMSDPQAMDTAYLSIVPFGASAYQLDLTSIAQFMPPAFAVDQPLHTTKRRPFARLLGTQQQASLTKTPPCVLGSALHLLTESIESDLIPNVPGTAGDYRPLVLVLIGSHPTDDWRQEATRLQALRGSWRPTVTTFIIGSEVDAGELKSLTDNVLTLRDVTPEIIRSIFRWISASLSRASDATSRSSDDRAVQAPPLPPGITFDV